MNFNFKFDDEEFMDFEYKIKKHIRVIKTHTKYIYGLDEAFIEWMGKIETQNGKEFLIKVMPLDIYVKKLYEKYRLFDYDTKKEYMYQHAINLIKTVEYRKFLKNEKLEKRSRDDIACGIKCMRRAKEKKKLEEEKNKK